MDHQAFAQLLGNYGEFIGAIAVVVTLAYLSMQVKHSKEAVAANTESLNENRRLALANAYQARADLANRWHLHRAASGDLAEAAVKLNEGNTEGLANAEKYQLEAQMRAMIALLDNVHFQRQQGYVTDEFYESNFRESIRYFAPTMEALKFSLASQRPSFVKEIETAIARTD
jgi:hypothetical protein